MDCRTCGKPMARMIPGPLPRATWHGTVRQDPEGTPGFLDLAVELKRWIRPRPVRSPAEPQLTCGDCGRILDQGDTLYYIDRCEGCERAWSERIERWRGGGEDPELDTMFGG